MIQQPPKRYRTVFQGQYSRIVEMMFAPLIFRFWGCRTIMGTIITIITIIIVMGMLIILQGGAAAGER